MFPDAVEPGQAAALLERDAELAQLRDALTETRQGSGRVVLVEAPAGLGKTSLLSAACRSAVEAGFACLRARASELERDFAYGCVRQLLEPAVAKTSEAERERLFAGAAALSMPLLAPTGVAPSADSAFSMLHGLYWLLNNLADDAPVALAVDDVHWSDTESVRFLNYLAPRLDGLALVVLASTRSGTWITTDLARLAAGPETMVLRPGPLSIEATATLCERRLGGNVSGAFAAACREATGGNPFFLEALLHDVGEQGFSTDADGAARVRRIGPAAVAQAVLLRLSEAPTAATALVRAVAVLGDGAALHEAADLAELSEADAASAADLVAALAILEPGGGLEFAHPIVREAVYADIGPRERVAKHARAAEILAASGASEERIAAQITEAEPAANAERVELLRRVAADALARGAPAAAAAWLRRALAEPPQPARRAEVLLELGSAELRAGIPDAVDHLGAAFELLTEPALLAVAVRQLSPALILSPGGGDRAAAVLESAIDVVEPSDRDLALILEAELVGTAQRAGLETRAAVRERLERYAGLEGATPGERLVLASLAFERARTSGSAKEAAEHLERALAGGRLFAEHGIEPIVLFSTLMIGLLATDSLDPVDAGLEQALAEARAQSSIPDLASVHLYRGWVALRRGNLAGAEADSRMALELLKSHDMWLGQATGLAVLIDALLEVGDPEAAERELRGSGLGDEIVPGLTSHTLLAARGPVAHRSGQAARRVRRPGRIRSPRRALGRREPARRALALRCRLRARLPGRGRSSAEHGRA